MLSPLLHKGSLVDHDGYSSSWQPCLLYKQDLKSVNCDLLSSLFQATKKLTKNLQRSLHALNFD